MNGAAYMKHLYRKIAKKPVETSKFKYESFFPYGGIQVRKTRILLVCFTFKLYLVYIPKRGATDFQTIGYCTYTIIKCILKKMDIYFSPYKKKVFSQNCFAIVFIYHCDINLQFYGNVSNIKITALSEMIERIL